MLRQSKDWFCPDCGYQKHSHVCTEEALSMDDKCEHCQQVVTFDTIDGMWHHIDRNINTHQAKLDLRGRRPSNEFGPPAALVVLDEIAPCMRCALCAELVTPLATGGYVHNFIAIGDKMRFMRPSVILNKVASMTDLCPDMHMETAMAGSYDTDNPVPMDDRVPISFKHRYSAVNAAMTIYFADELERTRGLDWSDIHYNREPKHCGCPTCRIRLGTWGDGS